MEQLADARFEENYQNLKVCYEGELPEDQYDSDLKLVQEKFSLPCPRENYVELRKTLDRGSVFLHEPFQSTIPSTPTPFMLYLNNGHVLEERDNTEQTSESEDEMLTVHFQDQNVKVNQHKCHICHMSFKSSKFLKCHEAEHSNGSLYQCSESRCAGSDKQNMKLDTPNHASAKSVKHQLLDKPANVASKKPIKFQNLDKCANVAVNKPIKCRNLDKPADVASKKSVTTYSCENCHYSTRRFGTLKIHMKTHQEVKFCTCDLCQQSFHKLSNLKAHLSGHLGLQQYECNVCKCIFSHPFHLTVHMRSHTQEKLRSAKANGGINTGGKHASCRNKNKCMENNHQRLNQNKNGSQLRQRRKIIPRVQHKYSLHKNKQLLKNKICKFVAVTLKDCKLHEESCGDKKLHICKVCSFSCDTSKNLKEHVRTHHTQLHKCSVCEYLCRQQKTMTRHMEKHSDVTTLSNREDMYNCNDCDFSADSLERLQLHMSNHVVEEAGSVKREVSYRCVMCLQKKESTEALIEHLFFCKAKFSML